MKKEITGIEKSPYDKIQPYRVWRKGKIILFTRTLKEAEEVLKLRK